MKAAPRVVSTVRSRRPTWSPPSRPQAGISLDRKKLVMPDHIKSTGEHNRGGQAALRRGVPHHHHRHPALTPSAPATASRALRQVPTGSPVGTCRVRRTLQHPIATVTSMNVPGVHRFSWLSPALATGSPTKDTGSSPTSTQAVATRVVRCPVRPLLLCPLTTRPPDMAARTDSRPRVDDARRRRADQRVPRTTSTQRSPCSAPSFCRATPSAPWPRWASPPTPSTSPATSTCTRPSVS